MVRTCQPSRMSRRFAGMLLATLIGSSPCLAENGKLSLTTGALPPLTASPDYPGFLNDLAREAFKRIGIDVEVTAVPVERALINVNSGLDDGDVFRVAGAELTYPNLIRIPEKVLNLDFIAYSKLPGIQLRTWADLQPYAVGYGAGWKIFERNVKNVKEVTNTPSIHELFYLLEKGRVDVILMDRWQGQLIVRQRAYQLKPIEPPLASVEMFMYLNKKHAALVPKVAQALRDMKADGSYKKIYDATLKPLDTR
jgi:polar amino acid transport system substrate-binding protein